MASTLSEALTLIGNVSFTPRMKRQAQLLTIARVVLGPKTTSEQLLATTFRELKRVMILRMENHVSTVEKLGSFLGLANEDFIYKTKTSVVTGPKPASRMALWRIFNKISDRFLIVLRRTSQAMMKKIVASTAAPVSKKTESNPKEDGEEYIERRVGKMIFREKIVRHTPAPAPPTDRQNRA